jgi:hypothetical protein
MHRLIRAPVRWDVETLINMPATMLIGIALVIFAFNLATPISCSPALSPKHARYRYLHSACI